MRYLNIYYPESKFGGFTDVDGTITFYMRVNALLSASVLVADVGCGRGAYAEDPVSFRRELRILKGKCQKVIGIDVDGRASDNPFVDEFRLIENEQWPLDDESVDLCVCDWVLEHVNDPHQFFSECRRVLKPAGYLCIRTSNALNYIGLASRLIPHKFHGAVINKVQVGRTAKDAFPTLYRCNTVRQIRCTLHAHGFDQCVYGYESEPSYFSFSRLFYWLGVVHQRLAPNIFRAAIFAFGRKLAN